GGAALRRGDQLDRGGQHSDPDPAGRPRGGDHRMSRMRIDRTRSASLVFGLLLLLPACGGDDGGGNGGGGDGGPVGEDPCGFDSDDYLPYEAGFTWTYRVTDLGTGARETKEQRIDPEMEHPDYGAVLVQV